MRRTLRLGAILVLLSCSERGTDAPPVEGSLGVRPTAISLSYGQAQQFAPTPANAAVTWTVREAGGGSVTGTGFYTAPSTPGTFHVVATSVSAPSVSATASVLVAAPESGVTVHAKRVSPGASLVSFGVPVKPGDVTNPGDVRVSYLGAEIPARVEEILAAYGPAGDRIGTRAILVQAAAPTSADEFDLQIEWTGGSQRLGGGRVAFASADLSASASETARVVDRTIVAAPGGGAFVESNPRDQLLFTSREPRFYVSFPPGYLGRTGILGKQVAAAEVQAGALAGLKYLSDQFVLHAASAIYDEPYALNPAADSVVNPETAYEGWLYDRCATFLLAWMHSGEERFQRYALRACSWYAARIDANGIFTGKSPADNKYSHQRGLYAYYALTGDEAALTAGTRIATMWLNEPYFVAPYLAGRVRSATSLWTERLLGVSMEGLFYGHRFTGSAAYLDAFKGMLDTAYRHLTGDAAALAVINPYNDFPPQNCFIHNAAQHEGLAETIPWCSGWMTELVVDVLLRYEEQTLDPRVDEMFVRLARHLRDTGTSYFRGGVLNDTFLAPSICYDPRNSESPRLLVPMYGAALYANGSRYNGSNYDDYQHCADATAMTAAAIRALKRLGIYDSSPVGPFASEGAAALQLHHELSACASWAFEDATRPKRNPANWTAGELAGGISSPAAFISNNKIGYPQRTNSPLRRVSWWFNSSIEQFGLLDEAGVSIDALTPGVISRCP